MSPVKDPSKTKSKPAPKTKASAVDLDRGQEIDALIAEVKQLDDPKEKVAQVAPELGKDYRAWKDSEGYKNKLRDLFFEIADEDIETNVLRERKTETVILRKGEDIYDAIKTRFPDMEIVKDPEDESDLLEQNPDDDSEYVVVLRPRADYMKYDYVDKAGKMVYSRGRTDGKQQFDTDGYLAIVPSLADELAEQTGVAAVAIENDLRGIIRKRISFDMALDTDTDGMTYQSIIESGMAQEQSYLDDEKGQILLARYPILRRTFLMFTTVGAPTMKLNAPRKAKKDEL